MDLEKLLGPYSKQIKEIIVRRGRGVLSSNGKCDDPNFVGGLLLYHIAEKLNVIRKIVDDENHPWMLEHTVRMAQYARENAPENEQTKKSEQEAFGQHYETTRGVVLRAGRRVFEFKWLVKELSTEQQKLLHAIVNDENHKWMVDHVWAKREGHFIRPIREEN